MKVSEQVKYDIADYVKIGIGLFIAILAILAMFSTPTSKVQLPTQLAISSTVAVQQPAWLLLLIGFAIGCYGTIVGIGGGPLILPLLVFFYGWENEILVATTLFIVFLNAASGCSGYAMQKRIDYKGGVQFTAAAIPGALISGYFHHLVNLSFFNVIFGLFLLCLAIYTMFSVSKVEKTAAMKKADIKRAETEGHRLVRFTDRFGIKYKFYANDKLGISMNLLLGFFCGFLGIGGGVFQVPILLFLLFYPLHIATATSHFVTFMTCGIALIPHLFFGNIMFGQAIWMGIGVVTGAQVGARIAAKLNSKVTLYLFIIILFVFAIKLFLL
jgi:uncharacterized membrane protein YfcA